MLFLGFIGYQSQVYKFIKGLEQCPNTKMVLFEICYAIQTVAVLLSPIVL